MELANDPVPVPSAVFEPEIVGPVVVLQQTPRAVTVNPPSLVTLPPVSAASEVIEVITFVVTAGRLLTVTVTEALEGLEHPVEASEEA